MIRTLALLLTSMFYSIIVWGESQDLKLSHSWMNENYETIEANLYDRNSAVFFPTVSTLVDIWSQRDGALSGEVSPLILVALQVDPETTLSLLAKNYSSFEKWLNELEGMVFTDHTGVQKDELEQLRVSTLSSLNAYSEVGEMALLSRLLADKLMTIEVRVID